MTQMEVRIPISESESVSGLLIAPNEARICYVFAHGAGAGMAHAFMTDLANELAERSIATLRYQFPYMEKGGKRPDLPKVAHTAVRAACSEATRLLPKATLIAGGKSFGGRMTSQAQATKPLDGVAGLVFVGFPLHPPKQPSIERAKHLSDIKIPMLFLQGTRDELAELDLIKSVTANLDSATIEIFDDADHSFHVRKSSGSTDEQVLARIATTIADWSALLTKK